MLPSPRSLSVSTPARVVIEDLDEQVVTPVAPEMVPTVPADSGESIESVDDENYVATSAESVRSCWQQYCTTM
ncbi:MAG: hypothetical protein U0894_16365 [Pirellulales bacterium]